MEKTSGASQGGVGKNPAWPYTREAAREKGQNLRSSPHTLQSRQCTLWICEDELSLALPPGVPSVETLTLHNEVGHQAQRDMMLLGTLPCQGLCERALQLLP
jgi:hypothetical protein